MTSIATLEGTHNMHISSLGFTAKQGFTDSIAYLESLVARLENLPSGTLDPLVFSNVQNTIAPLLETLRNPPEGWTEADAANMMAHNADDLDNDERILAAAESGANPADIAIVASQKKMSLAVPIAVAVAAYLIIK